MIGAPGRILGFDEVVRALPGVVRVVGSAKARIGGVRHDSRAVQAGDLFVARRGEKVDGARFVEDAVARGAVAIVAERSSMLSERIRVPIIWVDDTADALAFAAHAVYGHPSLSLDIAGITGTNGKTTTAHLVRAAIDGAIGRSVCGVLGTLGNAFGAWQEPAAHTTAEADDIARTLATFQKLGATHAAMEVSSHGLELGRVRAMRFRVAALTNLTQDHLDFHGSMAAYAHAKARLFTELGPAAAVLNIDGDLGENLARECTAPVVRVSARLVCPKNTADVAPRRVILDARGIDATIATPSGDVHIASRLIGAHNLDNLLLALGIAHALGLDPERAAEALSQEPGPPGRLERCDAEGDSIVALVDYAHTPDALARVLDALGAVTRGRVWCVFGAGGDRDPTKRGPMGEAVARRADFVVVTSDNPRTEDPALVAGAVAKGVRAAGVDPLIELDRRKAIELAIGRAREGDVVLVAGKGHEDYQVVGRVKLPFDDRIEMRRALERRRSASGPSEDA